MVVSAGPDGITRPISAASGRPGALPSCGSRRSPTVAWVAWRPRYFRPLRGRESVGRSPPHPSRTGSGPRCSATSPALVQRVRPRSAISGTVNLGRASGRRRSTWNVPPADRTAHHRARRAEPVAASSPLGRPLDVPRPWRRRSVADSMVSRPVALDGPLHGGADLGPERPRRRPRPSGWTAARLRTSATTKQPSINAQATSPEVGEWPRDGPRWPGASRS